MLVSFFIFVHNNYVPSCVHLGGATRARWTQSDNTQYAIRYLVNGSSLCPAAKHSGRFCVGERHVEDEGQERLTRNICLWFVRRAWVSRADPPLLWLQDLSRVFQMMENWDMTHLKTPRHGHLNAFRITDPQTQRSFHVKGCKNGVNCGKLFLRDPANREDMRRYKLSAL